MIDAEHCQAFAAYNTWMNEKVYACAAQLPDDERKRDRGAFFRSIHSTLNHILWADRLWIGRFTGRKYETGKSGVDLYADFDHLRLARVEMDADITDWAMHLKPGPLEGPLTWFSGMLQKELTRPLWLCVSHFHNHQTHHRGQVTDLLMQAGIDPGVTDFVVTPLGRDEAGRIILAESFGL